MITTQRKTLGSFIYNYVILVILLWNRGTVVSQIVTPINWWSIAEFGVDIKGVELDADLNVYAIGNIKGSSTFQPPIGITDIFVAKYDGTAGWRLWWQVAGGQGCTAEANAIALDGSTLLIAAEYKGCSTFTLWNNVTLPSASSDPNGLLLRIGLDGSILHYRVFTGGTVTAVEPDPAGVFIGGTFNVATFSALGLTKAFSRPNGFWARLDSNTFDKLSAFKLYADQSYSGPVGVRVKKVRPARVDTNGDRVYVVGETDAYDFIVGGEKWLLHGYMSMFGFKFKMDGSIVGERSDYWALGHYSKDFNIYYGATSFEPVDGDYQTLLVSNRASVFNRWEEFPEYTGASPKVTYVPVSGETLYFYDASFSTQWNRHLVVGYCSTNFQLPNGFVWTKKGVRDLVLIYDNGEYNGLAGWVWGVANQRIEGRWIKARNSKVIIAGVYSGNATNFYVGGPTLPATNGQLQSFLALYDIANNVQPPIEEPPVDAPSADDTPIEDPPVDDPPLEEPTEEPVEEPVAEPPIEEPPIDPPSSCFIPSGLPSGICQDNEYVINGTIIFIRPVELSGPVIINGEVIMRNESSLTITGSNGNLIVNGCVDIRGGVLHLTNDSVPNESGVITVIKSIEGCLSGSFTSIVVDSMSTSECEETEFTPTYSTSQLDIAFHIKWSDAPECAQNSEASVVPLAVGVTVGILGALIIVAVIVLVTLKRQSASKQSKIRGMIKSQTV